jgi:hypothetical protein
MTCTFTVGFWCQTLLLETLFSWLMLSLHPQVMLHTADSNPYLALLVPSSCLSTLS